MTDKRIAQTNSSHRGTGYVAKYYDEQHPYFMWGRYWRSQAVFEEYKQEANRRRRITARGRIAHTAEAEEIERLASELIKQREVHDRRIRVLKAQILKKYDMKPNSNRHHFRLLWERTQDPDVRALLTMMSAAPLNDTQRLNRIRQLFMEKKPASEILYETAIICGINLRKAS